MGINKDYIIIENNNIGYKIFTSGATMAEMPGINDEVMLYLEQIVREDFIGLYGFKDREELEIIIVTSSKFRNKKARPIVKGFLKRYPEVEREYNRLKKINEEQTYYFQIIRNGSLRKYIFLENIYTTCVKSAYTPAAIESIKIARGQINFNERG